jgi:hypothetical protein
MISVETTNPVFLMLEEKPQNRKNKPEVRLGKQQKMFMERLKKVVYYKALKTLR